MEPAETRKGLPAVLRGAPLPGILARRKNTEVLPGEAPDTCCRFAQGLSNSHDKIMRRGGFSTAARSQLVP